jgi:hypothetical protein
MITVAFTVPFVFERSAMRGQPPIETSPRPSATGSLQAAVGVLLSAGAVVELLVDGAVVTVLVLALLPAALFAHTNLLPVFLHTNVTPLVFCV